MLSLLKAIADLLGVRACARTCLYVCIPSGGHFQSFYHFLAVFTSLFWLRMCFSALHLPAISFCNCWVGVLSLLPLRRRTSLTNMPAMLISKHKIISVICLCKISRPLFMWMLRTCKQPSADTDCDIYVTLADKLLRKAVVGIWGVCKCLCVLASVIYSELQSQAPINRWQGARLIAAGQ